MYFSKALIATVLFGFSAAQSSIAASETLSATPVAATNGPGAGATGTVTTHVVQVGGPNGTLTFSPNNVKANVGDLVQFQFWPKEHSVVQATFNEPCQPIQSVMSNATNAFFSGFMPTTRTANDTKNILTYTIRVMNTTPMWYYCSQAKHCQSGMVGAINAATTGNKTVEAYVALAAKAANNVTPGAATNSTSSTNSGTGTGSAASASAAAAGGGSAASGTAGSSASPAQATTGAASALTQSVWGLGAAGLVAMLLL